MAGGCVFSFKTVRIMLCLSFVNWTTFRVSMIKIRISLLMSLASDDGPNIVARTAWIFLPEYLLKKIPASRVYRRNFSNSGSLNIQRKGRLG